MNMYFNFILTHEKKIQNALPVGKMQSSFHLRFIKAPKCQLKIQWTWAAFKLKIINPKLQETVSITNTLAA